MNIDKPHKGRIVHWAPCQSTDKDNRGTLGYYIKGVFLDHPQFYGKPGYTSNIVARKDNEIETRNSRYTLVP